MLLFLLPGCPWIPEPVEPEGSADGPETCATILYADADGDGYGNGGVAEQRCTEVGWVADDQDCDDGDAAVYPGAQESCDGVDQDCDGDTDEEPVDGEAWYPDRDGDSFGDLDGLALFCEGDAPGGYVLDATDCDDGDREVNPDAQEACDDDDVDEDCDGVADDDDPGTDEASASGWYVDADGDGYGDMDATPEYRCDSAGGDADNADDCDDARDDIHPGADESDCADPVDYNCDGSVGYADADADGYAACEECDDGNADVNPSADEYCNDRDDDCDSEIDEDALDPATWYCDADGDGFGDWDCTASACDLPPGYSALATDCDDSEIGTYPGAREVVADGIDQDCDGGDACYSDLDSDGYTDGSTVASADLDCEDPGEAGASTPGGDCDDADASVNPAAIEVCDGDDDDCDGEIDEVSIYTPTWFRDADGDGYGDASVSDEACEAPGGYVADGSDCDDEDASANPAGTEACGGGDEDCDGAVDEAGASGEATWYADGDGDGYGDSEVAVTACEAPAESVAAGGDCDDADDLVHPGATEVCGNAVDDDCDGGAGRCTFEGNVAAVDAEAVLSEETGGDDLIAVASAGDVDGDGYPEVIVAASSEDTAAVNAGAVYLAWGPLSGSLSLGDDAVTKLTGESSAGGTLTAVAGVGDVNSDGYADFMAGAYGSASAYLVYGPAVTNGSLADADVVFSGAPFVGSSVAGGADLDGDGVDDLSIGTGAATSMDYLFFGGTATAWGDVADADATVQCGTCTGHAQYLGGDANDDGLDDAVIGAYQGDGQDGQACLILGAATLTGALEADATLYGAGQEYAAHSVAILDDVTGDGGADLLIGAGRGSQNAYIVDGRVSGTVELATDSSARISVIGYQACPAGDVDDDGNADIVGMGYLFLGPVTASLTTSDANATLAGGGAYPSCGAGDLDGDGVDDILFRSGGVYVVSGRPGL